MLRIITIVEYDECRHHHHHRFCPASIAVVFCIEGEIMANTVTLLPGQSSTASLIYLDSAGNPDPDPNGPKPTGVTAVTSDAANCTVTDNGDGSFHCAAPSTATPGTTVTLTFTDPNGLNGTGVVTIGTPPPPPFVPASIGVDFSTPA